MGTIFLTSCGFINELITNRFIQELPTNFKNMKVGIITTASEKKEMNVFAQKAYSDFLNIGFTNIQFIDIEWDDINLANFSIIYINGGNPFRLLYFFKQNNASEQLSKFCSKKTFLIAASAGAIVLGPTLELVHYFTPHLNEYPLNNLNGLGLIANCIFPHYDREDLFGVNPTIEERIQLFESETSQPVIRLKDDEFVIQKTKKLD